MKAYTTQQHIFNANNEPEKVSSLGCWNFVNKISNSNEFFICFQVAVGTSWQLNFLWIFPTHFFRSVKGRTHQGVDKSIYIATRFQSEFTPPTHRTHQVHVDFFLPPKIADFSQADI